MEYEKLNALFDVLGEETRVYEKYYNCLRKKDIVIEERYQSLRKSPRMNRLLWLNWGN